MERGITRLAQIAAAKAASAAEELEAIGKRAAKAIRDALNRQKA